MFDITPLLADPKGFHIVLDAIAHYFVGEKVDAVVGVESRGFRGQGRYLAIEDGTHRFDALVARAYLGLL